MVSISVVTPSLNQGRFIERTIRSVLDQGHAVEYVVRDGGSTDDTLAILERFVDRVAVTSQPDRGQAHAVNNGICATTGEVIGWLNSDDVYRSDAFGVVARLFSAHPELDVVYGDADIIDADDTVLRTYYTEPWDPARLARRCIVCQPAAFFRRRVVERFGLLDERLHYCMDYEYWLRLAAGGARFAYVPAVLAASRQHPATKTLRARLELHQELDTMLLERLGRVPESWLINHAHTLVEVRRTTGHAIRPPYAIDVIVHALQLAWHWNRAISPELLASLLGPVLSGARRRVRPT